MVEIRPTGRPQEMMLASAADIVIGGGAAGGGKTWFLLIEPMRHVGVPGFSAVTFRRTSPEITNPGSLWPESQLVYRPFQGRPNRQLLEWTFPSGMVHKFGHLQYDDTVYDWDGAQIALLQFDQLEQFSEHQFFYMLSRNRSTCGVRPYCRATCNPIPDDDVTGGWLHRFVAWWIDPDTGFAREDRAGVVRWVVRVDEMLAWADTAEALRAQFPDIPPKSVAFIPARLEDNPILMERDPGYRANIMAQPRYERERLSGNWRARPEAGKVFDRASFGLPVPVAPVGTRWVRYWDKAGTEDGGKWSAGVKLGEATNGLFYVGNVVRGQWSARQREIVIHQTADADGLDVPVWVEQEPGSGGKESAENTIRHLAGFAVAADRVTGDKLTRATPYAAQVEAGNVRLVRGEWNEAYLTEHHNFTGKKGEVCDQVDASSGAFNKLVGSIVVDPDAEQRYEYAAAGGFVL